MNMPPHAATTLHPKGRMRILAFSTSDGRPLVSISADRCWSNMTQWVDDRVVAQMTATARGALILSREEAVQLAADLMAAVGDAEAECAA